MHKMPGRRGIAGKKKRSDTAFSREKLAFRARSVNAAARGKDAIKPPPGNTPERAAFGPDRAGKRYGTAWFMHKRAFPDFLCKKSVKTRKIKEKSLQLNENMLLYSLYSRKRFKRRKRTQIGLRIEVG